MIDSAPMRRITQFVALMVVLLLAVPSVLAEAQCSRWLHSDSDPVPACCITAYGGAGHSLSADCHGSILSDSIASECNENACEMATLTVAAQTFTTVKPKTDGAASLVVVAHVSVRPPSGLSARSFESASAPGPAKNLLFQVFRI